MSPSGMDCQKTTKWDPEDHETDQSWQGDCQVTTGAIKLYLNNNCVLWVRCS